ncbi:MAG: hypothetical protein M3Y45_10255 [Actinomycetota bacterium]|nr:hypothetical protein [Actinomycetota bacterium]
MKRSLTGLSVALICTLALVVVPTAHGAKLPPKANCVTPIIKTVKKGNRQFKAEGWFMKRLHRAGCLNRAKRKAFKPFSSQCKAKTRDADAYFSTLQENFILNLDRLLLKNQPRLLKLDSNELNLLNRRKSVNRQIRNSGPNKRASLRKQVRRIDRQLVTVRTKRARINYSMNTKAITRRGAAGVWLGYFDGAAHGCSKAFRGSPYLTMMREHFLTQFAAAQYVSAPPTRSNIATWTDLLSTRSLALPG